MGDREAVRRDIFQARERSRETYRFEDQLANGFMDRLTGNDLDYATGDA